MISEALHGERLWMIGAGLCMVVATTAFLWMEWVEVAFVAATLGIVCWFLSLRNRLKKTIVNESEMDEDEDSGERDDHQ